MTDNLRRKLERAVGAGGADSSDYDLNKDVGLAPGRQLRDAAVLIAIQTDATGGHRLILTKRSSRLKHHPGQIAFPGGKVDPTDDGPVDAALREAEEEIGLPRSSVEVIGCLASHETVTGFSVTPVLAMVTGPFAPVVEAGEVDEVFTVPLSRVIEADNYLIEGRMWRGVVRRYYVVPHGPYYIWGATARMLRALADRIG